MQGTPPTECPTTLCYNAQSSRDMGQPPPTRPWLHGDPPTTTSVSGRGQEAVEGEAGSPPHTPLRGAVGPQQSGRMRGQVPQARRLYQGRKPGTRPAGGQVGAGLLQGTNVGVQGHGWFPPCELFSG